MQTTYDTANLIIQIENEVRRGEATFTDFSVEYGTMGQAIFYYYLYKYFEDSVFLKQAENTVERSLNMLVDISRHTKLITKFPGDSVCRWISSMGRGILFIDNNFYGQRNLLEYYTQIDNALVTATISHLKDKDYDFFTGSLSTGYYFLNRYIYYHDSKSYAVLNKIVRSICRNAIEVTSDQVCWYSPVYKRIYSGLSHGSAMIINFLIKIIEVGLFKDSNDKLKNIVYKAVSFLIKNKRDNCNGLFPYQFTVPEPINETQLSMCYGDIGILYAIIKACRELQFNGFIDQVEPLLQKTARRKLNRAYTRDASILYGCSGLYYIYRELYEMSNDFSFYEAYKYWYNAILSFRTMNRHRFGGFVFEYEGGVGIDPSAPFSFLWGIIGIGITLMIGKEEKELPDIGELLLTGKK